MLNKLVKGLVAQRKEEANEDECEWGWELKVVLKGSEECKKLR